MSSAKLDLYRSLLDDLLGGSVGSTASEALKQSIREKIEVGLRMVEDAMPVG